MGTGIKSGIKLGITGGIGSGKTSVCKVFSILGIPVFSADPEAKTIMETDRMIISSINSITGQDMYRVVNWTDRSWQSLFSMTMICLVRSMPSYILLSLIISGPGKKNRMHLM